MDDNLSLALGFVGAGLLLGVAGAAWTVHRGRREVWAVIESCSRPGGSLPTGQPGASGPLQIGEQVLRRVGIMVVAEGLLLWRDPAAPRLLEWAQIRRLLPLAAPGGEVLGVIVELAGRPWGPDRFHAPWSAALSAQVLERGHGRLAA
jgi:uncharacterized protein YjeT (DUF2065 family)